MWTAYYLKRAEPSLRIAVLEARFVGYGASGRNGGWVSGFFSGSLAAYASSAGRERVIALRRAMFATVDEVAAVLDAEGIDADFVESRSC